MSLIPGTRLGPYDILAPLGAGGMGEVFRARDSRLERIVAIKSLPAAFAREPARLARFEREARLLAQLNHPNIAGIYGLEEAAGVPCLVLEFVDGETLAQRLARGLLSVQDVLPIGLQIATALEAAHERGVVHRDLKPGNVMLTPAGQVKVLDFGLAKAGAEAAAPSDSGATSPVALAMTGAGIILGTAAYMSPEQARGRPVDQRTDIWAIGCLLFECLTGRSPFAGETVSDVIARILEREPDWNLLPAATPARLRDLVRQCLCKDAAERPQKSGEVRRELVAISAPESAPGGGGTAAAAAAAVPPSLAVLYFENLSSDRDSEYFCAGITEDILTDLSKIKGLRVASRNAVARFRDAPVDIGRVAAELGVGAVLEGSVRRAGERVRISAQLINAADGFHLWAERYDRTLEDVFAVQEEIASAIATALRGALTPAEAEHLMRDRPADVRAYDLYLKGREFYARYTPESLRYACELFEEAVEIEPGYALAWAGVADCYGQILKLAGDGEEGETIQRGLEAARRAIALDPRLAEGHKAEALVLRFAGELEGSRAANLRALEANPRHTPALINLAVGEFERGDLAAAERLIRRALEIDPQEAFAAAWLPVLLFMTGRLDEALAGTHRLLRLSADRFYITAAHCLRAAIHLRRGDLPAAEKTIREGRAAGAEQANLAAFEAAIAARSGDSDLARQLLLAAEASSALSFASWFAAAGAAVRCGDLGRAAGFLTRRINKSFGPHLVRLDPELHPLLDQAPFAPRRSILTLVWPLEAPPVDAARSALFAEVRTASGMPEPSETYRRAP